MLSIRAREGKKGFSLQLNVGQGAPPAGSGGFHQECVPHFLGQLQRVFHPALERDLDESGTTSSTQEALLSTQGFSSQQNPC